MSRSKLLVAALVALIVALIVGVSLDFRKSDSRSRTLWQQVVMPGALSQSHAFLANQCAACHTPVKGVDSSSCIACHADNTALLQRQPTAFHANITLCIGCHVEHLGKQRMPTTMDHSFLASTGHQLLGRPTSESPLSATDVETTSRLMEHVPAADTRSAIAKSPESEMKSHSALALPANHPQLASREAMLNCVNCHATKDRHQGLLGTDCVQCHATTQWTVADFVHPSTRSTECAQCHKPPPSHNMMHFSMMSAPLARQPNAQVNQCFMCHQTTVWNDIKGVGWKKVH